MNRRNWFTSAVAGVTGLLGLGTPVVASPLLPPPLNPRDYPRSPTGRLVYRREASSGEFKEIDWLDAKIGDRLIVVGISGNKLYECLTATVSDIVSVEPPPDADPSDPRSKIGIWFDYEGFNWSDLKNEFYDLPQVTADALPPSL